MLFGDILDEVDVTACESAILQGDAGDACGVNEIVCDAVDHFCCITADILERRNDDVVKDDEDGELNEHRETAAGRIVAFLLVEFHDLTLHFLLGGLVGSALVFAADRHFARTEFRLLNGVLLLLDTEGEQNELHEHGKEKDRQQIVSRERVESGKDASEKFVDSLHLVYSLIFIGGLIFAFARALRDGIVPTL